VRDPKFGACVSLGRVLDHPGSNHRLSSAGGVLAEEARELLQEFFARAGPSTPESDE
jgi:tRNA(Arg) A34 adenosine deaminase TadA